MERVSPFVRNLVVGAPALMLDGVERTREYCRMQSLMITSRTGERRIPSPIEPVAKAAGDQARMAS